jgi:quercetin dioxygenase-like cupin family protein
MSIVGERSYKALGPEDPDDCRPDSRLAFVIDPTMADGHHVSQLSFIFEDVAPGDRVPLHKHTLDEAIVIEEGDAEVVIGSERRTVRAGTVIFVPAGVAHGYSNATSGTLRIQGVFPADVIDIEYIERNPAPGTEGQPPQPPFSLDLRSLGT